MSDGVLVFEPEPDYRVVEGPGDVLVFTDEGARTTQSQANGEDVLIFEGDTTVSTQAVPGDLLLVDEPVPGEVRALDGSADVLVLTTFGGPGPTGRPGGPGPTGPPGEGLSDIPPLHSFAAVFENSIA